MQKLVPHILPHEEKTLARFSGINWWESTESNDVHMHVTWFTAKRPPLVLTPKLLSYYYPTRSPRQNWFHSVVGFWLRYDFLLNFDILRLFTEQILHGGP